MLVRLAFEAIGTKWDISLEGNPDQAQDLAKIVADLISEFDHNYSRFRPDSWLSMASKNPGSHKAPSDFGKLFEFYHAMYKATDGLVTPLIGDAMERAGYDAKYSLRPKTMRKIPKLEDILEFSDNTLHVKYSCVIDVGAAGKGYLVDLLGAELKRQGVSNFVIDAGGDILHHSPAPAKTTPVGLEDPENLEKVIGQVDLGNGSICGSAGNRRKWSSKNKKYNHIINPHTLQSVTDVKAVWVVAKTAMLADGLSTCLFFVGPKSLGHFDFEYLCIMEDNSMKMSDKFPGKLFYE